MSLRPPREVVPIIRTTRWSLLALGIIYGHYRLRYLQKREMTIQERLNEVRKQRICDINRLLQLRNHNQMNLLAKDCGVRIIEPESVEEVSGTSGM
ncbi:unnamed protein product [Protopolystoma xenopodis]|uniref:ATP synthase F(0) complex subunit e, mitochondrial n=1 Tax=Protopolystoma xenopodis TaxID=117903 RepID=A0A3S4ZX34_9PLAT|nr:unnamed protein product [Protopolystoma xenopodis]